AATAATADAAKPRFHVSNLPFNSTKLFDLSVADIEGDGDLDMFSANHKYRGSLQVSDGRGNFKDRLDASGLSSTSDLPGFDDLYRKPKIEAKGFYMWVDKGGKTHIRTKGLGSEESVPGPRLRGQISYFGRSQNQGPKRHVRVLRKIGAVTKVRPDRSTSPTSQIVKFVAGANANIVIRARFMDLPFTTTIDSDLPRSRIMLGPGRAHPSSNKFEIDLGDRHAVAWGDYNGDGITDAYISNGGVRGAAGRFGSAAADELYYGNGDGTFTEDIASTGIRKGECRGRHAAPVDYDDDGDLDIFVGCEDIHPQLFKQRKPGRFGERTDELQDVGTKGDLLRWVDLNESGPPELVTVEAKRRRIKVYKKLSDQEKFVKKQNIFSRFQGTSGDAIATADVDADGDIDVFVGSAGGNSLLINKGGRKGKLRLVRPERYGLPSAGTVAATFVDYDNDGAMDFHAVPNGLYERTSRKRYRRTGKVRVGARAKFAIAQWFDYDSDGDRDLISVLKRGSKKLRKQVFENRTRDGNWLQVDLRGPKGNPQAIGAEVIVGKGGSAQSGFVGQNEGSRFSSGHYRLYYGLGNFKVTRVKVIWPDGKSTVERGVRANQRVEISRGGGATPQPPPAQPNPEPGPPTPAPQPPVPPLPAP
ncbi:MAG: CRTAC1 family protein, partial [Solirubrobacterales bacterium]